LFHPIQVVRVRQDRWVARDSSGEPARTPPRFGKSGNTSHQRTRPKEPEFDAPTYYSKSASRPAVNPAAPVPKLSVTRAVVGRSNQAARYVTGRVVAASRADGAAESGLTRLIWNQVLSYSADAMITVALAGTVFFSAAQSDQRGNVLGYLLITMAPFALVAPVIGPVLDRFQHGRRVAMATSAFGRALLAILMAQNFDNLYALFPLALGTLVLSKAYSVVRAAAAPRLVPSGMTLVTANARLSLFGLAAMLIGGGVNGLIIKVSGSYWLGLWLSAVPFVITGILCLRLPPQVDSTAPAPRHPEEPPRAAPQVRTPRLRRLRSWASRGYGPTVVMALSSACVLRWATGFLTLFLAFWVQSESHGVQAAGQLAAIGAGLGIGNAVGNIVGARVHLGHPERLVVLCAAVAAAACLVTALLFGLTSAVICMFVTGSANSLGKIALDAVIQRDVGETLRSSAFARSETFLQLSWVVGAAIGILLPLQHGGLGMGVAAAVTSVAVLLILLRAQLVRMLGGGQVQIRPETT
jgi:hypothetical protein